MNKNENKILIITGGMVEVDYLAELVKNVPYDIIIAADHGLLAADQLKLPLDYIVGDFDSVPEEILEQYKDKSTPIETFPTEKDKTDTQIAIELALWHHPSLIDIIGATGSRLDHMLANIHLLLLPLQIGVPATIIDRSNKLYLKKQSFTITKASQHGGYVSLLPFTEKVNGLSLRGFKYPLDHITLASGNSLGVSNEIIEEEAYVEFSEGILLVVESKD